MGKRRAVFKNTGSQICGDVLFSLPASVMLFGHCQVILLQTVLWLNVLGGSVRKGFYGFVFLHRGHSQVDPAALSAAPLQMYIHARYVITVA